MAHRLSLDIGTNSIGWCVLALDSEGWPTGLKDIGVRVYPDGRNPKDKTSLAAARRQARSMRRRRDRYLRRRRNLMKALIAAGLMPADEGERKALEALDPFELRARGLRERLLPHEFGRALFHLAQRRGFKSNRQADAGDDDETGKIKQAVARLRAEMDRVGAKTLGEWYHHVRSRSLDPSKIPSVRARLTRLNEDDKQDNYPFYPSREMVEEEFDTLWRAQAAHHPGLLTEALRKRLHRIVFHQRPLKAPAVGKCLYIPEERRLPRAHPLAQRWRILQELNNLRIVEGMRDRPLSLAQRDRLLEHLLRKEKMTFHQMRKALKLPGQTRFNLESEARKHLDGDVASLRIAEGRKPTKTRAARPGMGQAWWALSPDRKAELVDRLLHEPDEEELVAWLKETHGLEESVARGLANTKLPDGHAAVGPTAMRRISDELEADVITYNEAVQRAGFPHHSDFRHDVSAPALPYYGAVLDRHIIPGTGEPEHEEQDRIGRLANPTVHIGLNQIRKLINALIAQHGKPAQINVELARELKQNQKQRKEERRRNRENQERHELARKLFAEVGAHDTGDNRLRHRLWLEQEKTCPYTGVTISACQLFSSEVDIDHILPFSKTLDNSAANKVVCIAESNREKRNKSPYEVWSHTHLWPAIEANARRLPPNKRWRFAADAMERYENEERDFLDRHLTETRYLGRLAREYLTVICPQVYVTPGQLTAMISGKLGLNDILGGHNLPEPLEPRVKSRDDHRHHAVDAFTVGLMDRSFLQQAATLAGRVEREGLKERIEFPDPFPGYREQLREALARTVVSHRPNHSVKGRMHNETALGLAKHIKGDLWGVVYRKPIDSFQKTADLDKIRDPLIRETLLERCYGLSGKDLAAELAKYADETGARRLRVIEPLSVIPIRDKNGKAYKAYKGDANHRIEIWRLPGGKWTSQIISMFQANQEAAGRAASARPHPAAKLIMRLHKDDMIAIEDEGRGRRILRVVKFSGGAIVLADHNEGGNLKDRDGDPKDPFKYLSKSASALQKAGGRKLRIDEAGRVWDPGPLER